MAEREIPVPGQRRKRQRGDIGGGVMPTLNATANPAGARWCDLHKKLECTGKRQGTRVAPGTPEQCHGAAVRGTNRCAKHAGVSRETALIAGEGVITAWMAMGSPMDGEYIGTGTAVLGMLQQAWMRAAIYGQMLRRQVEVEGVDPAAVGLKADGLIGHKMSATNTGEIYETSEEIRALVELESRERDRVVKFAEVAHKMGIADRMTDMAERWGDVVAGKVAAMLLDLNLTPEQERLVPVLIMRHLSAIDVQAIGGPQG